MSRNRAMRGFSMVEVMVAMAVLAIGLLAMTPLVSMAIGKGAQARELTAAQLLAQDLLERLRAEIRYDGGLVSDPVLVAADAWKFDVLPHRNDVNADPPECQVAFDDTVAYDHGPFEFVREDHVFRVCYDLHAITAIVPAVPVNSMEVRIRVLWHNATGGWSAWSISDLLVSGA